MADESDGAPERTVTEVVGRFAAREPFMAAIKDLVAAGFDQSDLSVLDTHEAITAAGTPGEAWQQALAGLAGEVRYVGPITAAGLIAIATGPIGAAVAAAVGAGVTGVAAAELLETMRATPHTESFARALEAGAVLLWVRAPDAARQEQARDILARHGAEDVHVHVRAKKKDE